MAFQAVKSILVRWVGRESGAGLIHVSTTRLAWLQWLGPLTEKPATLSSISMDWEEVVMSAILYHTENPPH